MLGGFRGNVGFRKLCFWLNNFTQNLVFCRLGEEVTKIEKKKGKQINETAVKVGW